MHVLSGKTERRSLRGLSAIQLKIKKMLIHLQLVEKPILKNFSKNIACFPQKAKSGLCGRGV